MTHFSRTDTSLRLTILFSLLSLLDCKCPEKDPTKCSLSQTITIDYISEAGSIKETSAKQGDLLLIECTNIDQTLKPELVKIQLTPGSDEVPGEILKGVQSFNSSISQRISSPVPGTTFQFDPAYRDGQSQFNIFKRSMQEEIRVAKSLFTDPINKIKAYRNAYQNNPTLSTQVDPNTKHLTITSNGTLLSLIDRFKITTEAFTKFITVANNSADELKSAASKTKSAITYIGTPRPFEIPQKIAPIALVPPTQPPKTIIKHDLTQLLLQNFANRIEAIDITLDFLFGPDTNITITISDTELIERINPLMDQANSILSARKLALEEQAKIKTDLDSAITTVENQYSDLQTLLQKEFPTSLDQCSSYGQQGLDLLQQMKSNPSLKFSQLDRLNQLFEKLQHPLLRPGRLSAIDQMSNGNVFYWIRYSLSSNTAPPNSGSNEPTRAPINYGVLVKLASSWRGIASAGFGFGALTNAKAQLQSGSTHAETLKQDPIAIEVSTLYSLFKIRDGKQFIVGPCFGIGVNQEGQARFYGGLSYQLNPQMLVHLGMQYGPIKRLKEGLNLNNLPPNSTEDQITSQRSTSKIFFALSWRLGQ